MPENQQPLATYVPPSEHQRVPTWNATEEPDDDAAPITVRQVLVILRAYWKVSVAVFAGTIALAFGAIFLIAKTYTGIATLIVHFNSLDPLAAKQFDESAQYSFLSTQMELLQSDSVLDDAIERLGLTKMDEYARGNEGGDATLRDWVQVKLRKNIEITQGRAGSHLIYVEASASSAKLSADIANAVADAFLEQQTSGLLGPSAERASRYSVELAALKHKVEVAQKALTDFREKAGTIDVDSKGEVEIDVLTALERRLLEARNALRSSQARVADKHEVTTSVLTSTTVSNLREEGNKLAAKMAEMRTVFGPNHPDVLALQSQINANQASLAAAKQAITSANSSDIVVTSNEVASLEKAVAAQRAKVLKVKQYHDQAAKFQLELESAQSVYKRALDGYDGEKFAASGQTSNISLANRARPPVKPVKPNRLKLLAIGFLLGLVMAAAVPFAIELPRRRIRCRDDLELDLGIPVLVELSEITQPTLKAGSRA